MGLFDIGSSTSSTNQQLGAGAGGMPFQMTDAYGNPTQGQNNNDQLYGKKMTDAAGFGLGAGGPSPPNIPGDPQTLGMGAGGPNPPNIPSAAPQTTRQQRILQSLYGDNSNLTNTSNWQGNNYMGPSTTYQGVNGQSTAGSGYTMGGGMQSYLSQYDPGAISDADIRSGLAAGKQGSRGLNQTEIDQFMQDPHYSQRYQTLADAQGTLNQANASNAAGAAASQAVNSSRNADFQGTLNSMYGAGDPHRVASNYTEQKVNGQYVGPSSGQPTGQANSAPPPQQQQQVTPPLQTNATGYRAPPAQQPGTSAAQGTSQSSAASNTANSAFNPWSSSAGNSIAPTGNQTQSNGGGFTVMQNGGSQRDPLPGQNGGQTGTMMPAAQTQSGSPSPYMMGQSENYLTNNAQRGYEPNQPQSGSGYGQYPPQGTSTGVGQNQFNGGQQIPMLANGTPDYMAIAQAQSQYNNQNAQQQHNMNNPNQYNPYGSQVRTQNADGTFSTTQSLNPQTQANFDASQNLRSQLLGNAQNASGNQLNYNNVQGMQGFNPNQAPAMGQFNTSGIQGIPQADQNSLNSARDAIYNQQTQYLDPQFKQGQSDLDSKLANQGIMPGSEAYNREMGNFNLQKQKAYGDARNSSIAAGGQEQSRLFGLGLQANQAGQANALNQFNTGLQSHQTGINDALAQFNTGMQGRQQGVSEANALHNAPINDLNALNGISNFQMPQFQGGTATSIPGVDYMNAANQGFNATMGVNNADAARQAMQMSGLFGLGSTFLNSSTGQNLLASLGGSLGGLFGSTNPYAGYNWGDVSDGTDYASNPFAGILE